MKKKNIIKKSLDFDRIIHNNNSYKYKDYIIYIEKNNNDYYRFGLSVGKKIGNAVTRNKVKRQLKSIIDKNIYKNGFDCIIIVGRGILSRSYNEMEINYNNFIKQFDILEEKNEK